MSVHAHSLVRVVVGIASIASSAAIFPMVGRADPLVVAAGETNTLSSSEVNAPPTTGLTTYLDFNAGGGTTAYDMAGFVVDRNFRVNPSTTGTATLASVSWVSGTAAKTGYGSGIQITAPSAKGESRGVSPLGPTSWSGTTALASTDWRSATYLPLAKNQPRTISAWIKPESLNTAAMYVGGSTSEFAQLFGYTGATGKFASGSGNWFGFYLRQTTSDTTPRIVLSNASGYNWTAYNPAGGYYNQFIDVGSWNALVADGQYHLLTATWEPTTGDAGTARVYLDGAQVGADASMDQRGATNFGISYADGSFGYAGATFKIDDVRTYGRAITAAEVQKTYLWDGSTTSSANPYAINTQLTVEATGTFDLNGTSQEIASLEGGGTVRNGNLTTGVDFKLSGSGTVTFSGSIVESATSGIVLHKKGTGTQTLAGNNAYSGPTFVGGGKLVFTGSNTGMNSAMTVLGGTLAIGDGSNSTAGVGSGAIAVNSYGTPNNAVLEFNLNADASFANSVSVGNFSNLRNVGTGKVTVNNANPTAGDSIYLDGGAAGLVLSNAHVSAHPNAGVWVYVKGDVTYAPNYVYDKVHANEGPATIRFPGTMISTVTRLGGLTASSPLSIDLATGASTGIGIAAADPTGSTVPMYLGNLSGAGSLTLGHPIPNMTTNVHYVLGNATMTGTLTVQGSSTKGHVIFGNGGTGGNPGATPINNLGRVSFNSSTDKSYTGVMSGSTGEIYKLGPNTLTFSAVNTYAGPTTVSAGTLKIDLSGAINSTSGITAETNARLRYDSSTALNRNVSLVTGGQFFYNSSAAYSGTLTFTNGVLGGTNWKGNLANLTIDTGKIVSPGNSPGIAETTAQTWGSGGTYIFELAQAGGTAGVGWDLITGTDLTFDTPTTPFVIKLASLTAENTSGPVSDFNQFGTYKWLLADFTNAINGFSSANVSIDTSLFTNTFPADAQFTLALGDTLIGGDNTQLYMIYSAPVPEPATLGLAGLGGIVALTLWGRRRS